MFMNHVYDDTSYTLITFALSTLLLTTSARVASEPYHGESLESHGVPERNTP
jgi:hypothetical protein